MAKLLYRPIGLLLGALAGLVAARIFRLIWDRLPLGDPVEPDEREAGWGAVLASAALRGVLFAVVRAAVRRAGAKGFERATGIWPGKESSERRS